MAPLGLVLVGAVAWALRSYSPAWFFASMSYADLEAGPGKGMLVRLLMLAAGVLGTWAVLRMMPRARSWLSTLGSYSIGAYLLHGLLVKFAMSRRWFTRMESLDPWLLVLLFVVAGVVIAVLGCWLTRWLKPLFNYDWLWRIGRKQHAAPADSRAPAGGA